MKGTKKGYLTAILHLSPYTVAGVKNMCPAATPGCIAGCLNLAGRGGMLHKDTGTNSIQEARKRKTIAFADDKQAFVKDLMKEIEKFLTQSLKRDLIPCVRLNGTSDVAWESIKVDGKNIMEHFPKVQFYDYTKMPNRKNLPKNYHLTFSLAENNEVRAAVAVNNGMNVAVVFSTKKNKPLPSTYEIGGKKMKVVDGDETDLRFIDPKHVIVGLRAKGRAKKDTSGFVKIVA
jgi:hypothetical protein